MQYGIKAKLTYTSSKPTLLLYLPPSYQPHFSKTSRSRHQIKCTPCIGLSLRRVMLKDLVGDTIACAIYIVNYYHSLKPNAYCDIISRCTISNLPAIIQGFLPFSQSRLADKENFLRQSTKDGPATLQHRAKQKTSALHDGCMFGIKIDLNLNLSRLHLYHRL